MSRLGTKVANENKVFIKKIITSWEFTLKSSGVTAGQSAMGIKRFDSYMYFVYIYTKTRVEISNCLKQTTK